MSKPNIFRLLPDEISVVDLDGSEAGAILHNLTTAEVKSLAVGDSQETFITDVRGKVLHHVIAIRTDAGYRLVGPGGSTGGDADAAQTFSERLAAHCDRYTIREDCTPIIRDSEFDIFVAQSSDAAKRLGQTEASPVQWLACPWLGRESVLALIPAQQADDLDSAIRAAGILVGNARQFHDARVEVFFPWYGVDLSEKNLPQEADRDRNAINFQKGCYLGQETVARLDALGQVQKKLLRFAVMGGESAPGDEFVDQAGKVVAKLTSVASSTESADGVVHAMGMGRRSIFESGSQATRVDSSGNTVTAQVVERIGEN